MKRKLRDWMLEGDADAGPRLDSLRARLLSPRPSAAETLLSLFRPAGAWATLAIIWIALFIANRAANRDAPEPHAPAFSAAAASLASLLPNESAAPIDRHS